MWRQTYACNMMHKTHNSITDIQTLGKPPPPSTPAPLKEYENVAGCR